MEHEKPLDPVIWLIASILDYPSAYMGGPSHQNQRNARRIIEGLEAEGYSIRKGAARDE